MTHHHQFDLIEFPASGDSEVAAARDFYGTAFGWIFTSYGEGYVDTADSGVTAGVISGVGELLQTMPLAVIYSDDLAASRAAVLDAGGELVHDVYEFPGGRRFHFRDPNGNELAVWGH